MSPKYRADFGYLTVGAAVQTTAERYPCGSMELEGRNRYTQDSAVGGVGPESVGLYAQVPPLG